MELNCDHNGPKTKPGARSDRVWCGGGIVLADDLPRNDRHFRRSRNHESESEREQGLDWKAAAESRERQHLSQSVVAGAPNARQPDARSNQQSAISSLAA